MRRAAQVNNDSGGPGSPIERGGGEEPGGSPGPSHPSSRAPPLSSAWSLARAGSTQQLQEGFNHTQSSPFQPFQQQQAQAQQLLPPQEQPPLASLGQRASGPPLSGAHAAALEQLQRAAAAPHAASDQGPQQQPSTQEASHQPQSRQKKPPRPQRARPPAVPASGAMDGRDATAPISTNTGTGGDGPPPMAPAATAAPVGAAAAPCDTAAAAAINTALFIINAAEAIRGGDLPQQGSAAESQLHRALELTVQVQREATSKLLQHAQADPNLRQQLQVAGLWQRLSEAAALQAMPPPGPGTQGAAAAAQQAQQAQQQGGAGMDQVASLLDLAPLLSSAATVMATLHGIPAPASPGSGAGAPQQQEQQGFR